MRFWKVLKTMPRYLVVTTEVLKLFLQVYFNYTRKSTEGWSITNILLDLTGGIANFGQMLTQSLDQSIYSFAFWFIVPILPKVKENVCTQNPPCTSLCHNVHPVFISTILTRQARFLQDKHDHPEFRF